jgi:hypothetical protein
MTVNTIKDARMRSGRCTWVMGGSAHFDLKNEVSSFFSIAESSSPTALSPTLASLFFFKFNI